jgi:hypothetical protein
VEEWCMKKLADIERRAVRPWSRQSLSVPDP